MGCIESAVVMPPVNDAISLDTEDLPSIEDNHILAGLSNIYVGIFAAHFDLARPCVIVDLNGIGFPIAFPLGEIPGFGMSFD